jgi:molecular chaperone Hsp33
MASTDQAPDGGTVVTNEFVRHRNALLTRAKLTDLYLDYYLHVADSGLHLAPEHDRLFKELLVVALLHAGSRPRHEYLAWTMNLQQPLLNMFVTADNDADTIVGRVFTENVKQGDNGLLYLETVRGTQPKRRSVVDFNGSNVFAAAESFFTKSEQRPVRLFDLGDEEYALLSSHPDCDLAWLHAVDAASLRQSLSAETVVPLERRRYVWRCGCTEARMLEILAPTMRQDANGLFQGDHSIRIECPRCAKPYRITREALEAYVAREKT